MRYGIARRTYFKFFVGSGTGSLVWIEVQDERVHPPLAATLPHTRAHSLKLRGCIVLLSEPRQLPAMVKHALKLRTWVRTIVYTNTRLHDVPFAPQTPFCTSPSDWQYHYVACCRRLPRSRRPCQHCPPPRLAGGSDKGTHSAYCFSVAGQPQV